MTRVTLPIFTLIVVLFCSTFSFSQNALSPVALKVEQAKQAQMISNSLQLFDQANDLEALPEASSALTKATILDLRSENLKSAFEAKSEMIELTLPRSEELDFVLELVRYQTISDDFIVTSASSNGESVPYQPGIHYRGIVKGANQSIAAVSIFKDEIIGVISTLQDGNMVLGKTRSDRSQYIFYKENDLTITNNFECGTDELDMSKIDLKQLQDIANSNSAESPGDCVKVYIECEHDMYLEKGSIANTVNYMTGLFNVVATLYQNESVVTETSQIFVWDTPDSYPTNSSSSALNSFRSTRPSFNGDLAHLVSRGAPAGGGVAWVDALCTSYNYAYSYVNSTYQVFPTYSWSVEVFTHEMGHNLGSPHTHACAWNGNNTAIDGCGPAAGYSEGCNAAVPAEGTIMSYCHLVGGVGINFNLGFGQQPGDLIRAEINAASCLSACGPPCTLSATVTGTNANNGNNGTATATASGGTVPYTYAWSNGGSTATITGLAPGTYTATVSDSGGCQAIGSYTVLNTTPCSDNALTLTIVLDNYPGETSWEVLDAGSNVVASSNGTYAGYGNGSTVVEDLCLPDGCYDFVIYDSYGDGICCAYGSGSYDLTENATGTSLASGGAFASSETTNFCVPTGTTQYTLTTSANGQGSVSPAGITTHNAGASITLSATPASGWQFDNWSGDVTGSNNPTNITINSNMNVTANFSQVGGGGCTYTTINTNDFEGGWGIWNDGGSDCRRSANDAAYANSGNYCVRLRDNTSTSVMTTDNLDLSSYEEVTIDFSYYVRSFENVEDFWLQYSANGGGSYTTLVDWIRTVDFNNNERHNPSVVITGTFSSTARFRFRADASGNSDWVYIDDVVITGCASPSPLVGETLTVTITDHVNNDVSEIPVQSNLEVSPTTMSLFPNPVSSELTVAYETTSSDPVRLVLMDFTGRVIREMKTPSGQHNEKIDVSSLNSGYYVVQMITGGERLVQKFVVAK
jgi:hypothetical protein